MAFVNGLSGLKLQHKPSTGLVSREDTPRDECIKSQFAAQYMENFSIAFSSKTACRTDLGPSPFYSALWNLQLWISVKTLNLPFKTSKSCDLSAALSDFCLSLVCVCVCTFLPADNKSTLQTCWWVVELFLTGTARVSHTWKLSRVMEHMYSSVANLGLKGKFCVSSLSWDSGDCHKDTVPGPSAAEGVPSICDLKRSCYRSAEVKKRRRNNMALQFYNNDGYRECRLSLSWVRGRKT